MNNTKEELKQNTPNTQQSVQPQQTQPTQSQPEAVSSPTTDNSTQEGFNLIPALTQEEKVKIKKKNTFNIGSVLSIIFLAVVAIGIVGFNILSKAQLNSKKSTLNRLERSVYEDVDMISTNNAILERALLYDRFKKGSFSHRKIIEYLKEIAAIERGNKRGRITFNSIEISEDLSFNVSGSAPNLEQVAYLWYLFGIDESIDFISLESVGKSEEGSRFSFEGKLRISNFSNE